MIGSLRMSLLFLSDHLPVGHRGRSEGREGVGCKDHLHGPHGGGGGRFLASAARIAVRLRRRRPETDDVSDQ